MTLRRKAVGTVLGCLLAGGSVAASACKPHTIIELPPEPAPDEPEPGPAEEPSPAEPEPAVAEPEMEAEPVPEPMAEPSAEPAMEPVAEPIAEPTAEPGAEPTAEPAVEPGAEPAAEPVVEPTVEPAEPIPDPPDSGEEPPPALRHRYSFSGDGRSALDEVAGADGTLLGGAALSGGFVALDGLDDYVQLPDGLLSTLEATTVMIWATWEGTECWERLFDFGNNLVVAGRIEADTSWFMTPHLCITEVRPGVRLEFRTTTEDVAEAYLRFTAAGPAVLPAGPHQYVATFEPEPGRMRLFIDGADAGSSSIVEAGTGAPRSLSELRDLDNWLGRSQYLADAFFLGSFDEVRIYGVALTPTQVQAAFDAGPDVVPDVD